MANYWTTMYTSISCPVICLIKKSLPERSRDTFVRISLVIVVSIPRNI